MKNLKPLIAAMTLTAGVAAFSGGAAAQSVEEIGSFQDWSAYSSSSEGQKICFMSSNPTQARGNYTRRG
ncbi:MAG: hypothetical protein P8X61_08410, partial [Limibacillus sp.]